MGNSTGKAQEQKPDKPYPEFPLYAHNTRRWAKKIKGHTRFFGPWNDWQAALVRYEHDVHYWQRGQKPPPMDANKDAVTVGYLVNKFLEHREGLVESGELARQTWLDYKRIGEDLIKQLGRHTAIEYLTPDDFARLRKHFATSKPKPKSSGASKNKARTAEKAKTKGLVSVRNSIARSMAIFNDAHKARLISRPVDTGESFQKPKRAALKREKLAKNNKSYSVDELKTLFEAANPQTRCFILLGLNGGLGNADIGKLEHRHVVDGWVDFPRPKTMVDRRFPLWPETASAIEATKQTKRPDLPYLFLTKYGIRWFKDSGDDPLSKEFRKLSKECDCHKNGRGFYALRHVFRSVARGCRDREAVEVLGTDDEQVLGWIHSGELVASNVARVRNGKRPRWRIAEADLGRFLLSRRHPASQATKTTRRHAIDRPKQYV